MIQRHERYVNSVLAKNYIKNCTNRDLETLSGEEVIDILFGSYNNDYYSEMKIVDEAWEPKTLWWHRLNRFWAYPLTFIVSPFQYIVKGKTGWSDDTRFGMWISKVTGYR